MKTISCISFTLFFMGCGSLSHKSLVKENTQTQSDISRDEAKAFLDIHFPEAFPGFEASNVALIKVIKGEDIQVVCYDQECWPVRKEGEEIRNLATEIAITHVPAIVEFETISDPNRDLPDWRTRSFALQIVDATKLSNILRWLDGYSSFNSYHINISPKGEIVPQGWTTGFYYEESERIAADDLIIDYQAPGKLEEIYDGLVGSVLKDGAEGVRENPFYQGEFITFSPWSVYAHAVVFENERVADRTNLNLLPTKPSED